MSIAVVKLGGSSAASASLAEWLAAIEASTQPLVLVPGGGPFADCVRTNQQALSFSDDAAHAMALLAMEQFGYVLLDKAKRLTETHSEAEIRLAFAQGCIPVWFPRDMALSDRNLPASWDITSDSLAAWLAAALGAETLLLIKQTDDFAFSDTPETLTASGVVDAALSNLLPAAMVLQIAGPRDLASARQIFAKGKLPGQRISRTNSLQRAS